ncbi:GAF domain-containing protein [Yersinia enterocolitica]|uniref:GAF domain-containing protein n=1 Tax=Yersinia enterocolitica TaxID=630 RepID=UPI00285C1F99|nr:GAF domain-containing protein [Yersinia enterocolitica]EKN4143724.1 GAF domain-containing protein [Yersinia enterocolitica]HDL6730253.1 GAF domain-containing protein [Yersinia enterocolitica]HDL7333299.1 GAF domain-containing protein [Yersinia enterocolitica]HDM8350291.1 GAF domain-containing protein [Yersinia enterocolitica]
MEFDDIHGIIKRNQYKNARFSSYFIGFFSIWNAFIIPIILGIGISYLFQFQGRLIDIPNYYIAFYVLLFVIHIIISFTFLYLDKKEDTSSHLESTINIYNNLANEFKSLTSRSLNQSELHQTQKAVIHFTTLLIMNKLNIMAERAQSNDLTQENVTNDAGLFFNTVLGLLSSKREVLFGYKSESKFNIALYLYDPASNSLNVRARLCDDRLQQRNRSWKSGFGHVGLTHLHKEIKICPDITKSSELNSDDENDNINYRSFLSVPIMSPDSTLNEKCIGVLVLTSADANQFKIDRDGDFLLTFSYLLTIYVDSMVKIYVHDAIETQADELKKNMSDE